MWFIWTYRLNKFLQYLTEAGFRVSRTHFDPTGVRTDATLQQFKSVLTKYSVHTCTTSTTTHTHTQTSVSTESTPWSKGAEELASTEPCTDRVWSGSLELCLIKLKPPDPAAAHTCFSGDDIFILLEILLLADFCYPVFFFLFSLQKRNRIILFNLHFLLFCTSVDHRLYVYAGLSCFAEWSSAPLASDCSL